MSWSSQKLKETVKFLVPYVAGTAAWSWEKYQAAKLAVTQHESYMALLDLIAKK